MEMSRRRAELLIGPDIIRIISRPALIRRKKINNRRPVNRLCFKCARPALLPVYSWAADRLNIDVAERSLVKDPGSWGGPLRPDYSS